MPDTGYVFPAEWESHSATWLTWPHNRDTWPNNLVAAQREFETLVRTLADVEQVNLLAHDELSTELNRQFQDNERITIFDIPSNDSWIRDYGPTFVKSSVDGSIAGINWSYDGWGEKYPPFDLDQQVAKHMLDACHVPRVLSPLILEGGAIDTNGKGTVMTTSTCQSRRNPEIGNRELASELQQRLGMEQLLMLDSVEIEGDDTDGHIDQVARFVCDKRIVVSRRQMPLVQASFDQQPASESGFDLIPLPDPDEVRMFGSVLPTSYTNFYIANGMVVVPRFGVAQDGEAVSVLADLFPDRFVISLPSRELAVGLGSFHCLTQQQPA